MSKAVHILLSKDITLNTGVCKNCGPVTLGWRIMRGSREPRCGIAVKAQRKIGIQRKRTYEEKKKSARGAHGLTYAEAREICETVGECVICGETSRLCIDHCHDSKKVRGVLCSACNCGLGFFRDSPELLGAAIAYLEKHRSPLTESG